MGETQHEHDGPRLMIGAPGAIEGDPAAEVPDIEIRPGSGAFAPDERAQVIKWITRGVSRNQIARLTGRGVATITRIAQAEGLSFSRADMMGPAHEAISLSLRTRRLELRDKLLEDTHRLREQLWKQTKLIQLNYKSGEFVSIRLKEPTFADKRNIATAIGIFVDKLAILESLDAPQENKQAIIALLDNVRIQVSTTPREVTAHDPNGRMDAESDRDSGT
jgi:hypothetical protein